MNLVEELKWRGLLHDMVPGTEEHLNKQQVTGYIGFDPTSDSLHIGNMVPIMLLIHLQRAGHKPVALVGGATGMVGDPSGKSAERNLLSTDVLNKNVAGIKKQLEKFLDFSDKAGGAVMVNNYDWFREMSFLDFIRDVGKHISINYMMAKDSVQNRLETGLSFTEFSYQLIQGFDFYYLNQKLNCTLQMGGSDQWGNMTTGTELIRRKGGGEAFVLTAPLVTKADGSKFGKSEKGNVWLDEEKTSPYQFYQFWLNVSDEDASRFIRIFTLLPQDDIIAVEERHKEAPHLRELQKLLAAEVTTMVHSREAVDSAITTSELLFGQSTREALQQLNEKDFLSALEGVPSFEVDRDELAAGIVLLDLVAVKTTIFPSKGEARKLVMSGGLSLNKEKISDPNQLVDSTALLNNKYLLLQKGKKNYFLIKVQ